MKRITIEELPKILTEDVLNILVEMALEDPKPTFDWANVSDLLEERGQLKIVLDKVREIKKAIEKAKEDAKSEEQKSLEEEHNKRAYESLDPRGFYGNMGQPTGVYDYKNRYGVWPPGLDDSIAPLNLTAILNQEQIVKLAELYLKYRKNVQWEEVYSALQKKHIDFQRIFNNVLKMNNGIFPLDTSAEEFKDKYGVWPPGHDGNKI